MAVIVVTSIFAVLAILSVGLRVYVCRKAATRLSIDNAFVAIAAASSTPLLPYVTCADGPKVFSAVLVGGNIVAMTKGSLGYGRQYFYLEAFDSWAPVYQVRDPVQYTCGHCMRELMTSCR